MKKLSPSDHLDDSLHQITEELVSHSSPQKTDSNNQTPPAPSNKEKKKILVSLLISLGMTQTLYMNISTLLPLEARDLFGKGVIPNTAIALIIAMFEIAYIISTPIIGYTLERVGRKNYIVLGYLIIVIGTIGTGFLPLI